ncbi:MAG TPA: hypothetical protein VEI52_03920 [Terriglobales bacterium]|nr:hypothetical protein [Terriglobales bacterium]
MRLHGYSRKFYRQALRKAERIGFRKAIRKAESQAIMDLAQSLD